MTTQNSKVVGTDDSKHQRNKPLVERNKLMEFENLLDQGTCFCYHVFLCPSMITKIFVIIVDYTCTLEEDHHECW